MATKRTAEVLFGAFQDEMVTRRKFDVKNSKDEIIMSLYFKPITRYARVKATQLAGTYVAKTASRESFKRT